MRRHPDIVIIGAGVIGLSIAISILNSNRNLQVAVLEKERTLGAHASGRNSGVLHAGFYYSADSLKARFCSEGNVALRALCREFNIPVREVGKVVVTTNALEEELLAQLYERGIRNGVKLELLEKRDLGTIEPLAVTQESFIWSPTTAVSDPESVLRALASKVTALGGTILFGQEAFITLNPNTIATKSVNWQPKHLINASGTQADRIAKCFGFGEGLTMIPFMGVYRCVAESKLSLKRLVYPVPNPLNPFLGVHLTISAYGLIKIGPTAIPLLNREQYSLLEKWNLKDIRESIVGLNAMFHGNFHSIPALARSEFPKIFTSRLVSSASRLVPSIRELTNWEKMKPGIRAQLVDTKSGQLVNDFLVDGDENSTHVLNAVSPGWTAALPFGNFVAQRVLTHF